MVTWKNVTNVQWFLIQDIFDGLIQTFPNLIGPISRIPANAYQFKVMHSLMQIMPEPKSQDDHKQESYYI